MTDPAAPSSSPTKPRPAAKPPRHVAQPGRPDPADLRRENELQRQRMKRWPRRAKS